jgi:hypothetical protein
MNLNPGQRDTLVSVSCAFFFVVLLRIFTPIAAPLYDARQYLGMAISGLGSDAPLAAPFAYRPAVSLVARCLIILTHVSLGQAFTLLVLASSYITLVLSYNLARTQGVSRFLSGYIVFLLAASLFVVRYSLYAPFLVDAEAQVLSFAAFYCVIRGKEKLAVVLSLPGLFFGEFLIVPLIIIAVMALRRYRVKHEPGQLWWGIGTIAVLLATVALPRILIPIHAVYGANLVTESPVSDRLLFLESIRLFAINLFDVRQVVNIVLAFLSFWLPVLVLLSRRRWELVATVAEPDRSVLILWVILVASLTFLGNTNSMIFVTYTAPVVVYVLSQMVRAGSVSVVELVYLAIVTVIFNRAFLPLGTPGGDPLAGIRFYGGYWNRIDTVTLWRFGEIIVWVGGGMLLRKILNMTKTVAEPAPQPQ